ncbi:hypothetical protein [Aeromicrobium sp. 179-A 4D2 NHS]|uniref:hypothetical protein n=1 Tax=Aeromicrobium sp. 179-A 4D2 NHS TaxID=3142375 RepID=UPI0039A3AE1C
MSTHERPGRPAFSGELATAVGHVVLEASQCEDALGEMVLLASGNLGDTPDNVWWTSGERLASAVEASGVENTSSMADEYRRLTEARNIIVHGLWLESPTAFVVMTRGKSIRRDPNPPHYGFGTWTLESINDVADRFNALE